MNINTSHKKMCQLVVGANAWHAAVHVHRCLELEGDGA